MMENRDRNACACLVFHSPFSTINCLLFPTPVEDPLDRVMPDRGGRAAIQHSMADLIEEQRHV